MSGRRQEGKVDENGDVEVQVKIKSTEWNDKYLLTKNDVMANMRRIIYGIYGETGGSIVLPSNVNIGEDSICTFSLFQRSYAQFCSALAIASDFIVQGKMTVRCHYEINN
ncbi:hypothetical protein SNEBB_005490 [Seison nebaliae]|nr:hypothetical protein SNEBB_005490 [Seison nebaliae]